MQTAVSLLVLIFQEHGRLGVLAEALEQTVLQVAPQVVRKVEHGGLRPKREIVSIWSRGAIQ